MSAVDRINQKAAVAEAYRAQRRAQMRQDMPQVAAAIDEIRQHFPDAQVTWAREGGKTVGQKSRDGVIVQPIPEAKKK